MEPAFGFGIIEHLAQFHGLFGVRRKAIPRVLNAHPNFILSRFYALSHINREARKRRSIVTAISAVDKNRGNQAIVRKGKEERTPDLIRQDINAGAIPQAMGE